MLFMSRCLCTCVQPEVSSAVTPQEPSTLSFEMMSLTGLSKWARLTGQRAPELYLSISEVLGLQVCASLPGFLLGSCACKASALQAGLSQQPQALAFDLVYNLQILASAGLVHSGCHWSDLSYEETLLYYFWNFKHWNTGPKGSPHLHRYSYHLAGSWKAKHKFKDYFIAIVFCQIINLGNIYRDPVSPVIFMLIGLLPACLGSSPSQGWHLISGSINNLLPIWMRVPLI